MTYSFSFKAESKEGAIDKAYGELNAVADRYPEHHADTPAAQKAVAAIISALSDADADVSVSCSGWLQGNVSGAEITVSTVSLQVTASNVPRAAK